ncbi:acyl-CoA reductase-like NAD-dependent aldehyde dehydrogenase [Salsuginibacillus halophilus]|uniref:Aldehyde dehydrogenase n=1 Tax=Salsuginibacillus halophilus TaxID=517424 RepID=A0A2P8HBF1_9BACI|nr:aldehyde dehydrogenase family protein [Salsuginibacillus halophilus]PSL43555.1 acyl-CoA reductase-like NAD-dependent aldehyde dehydrogenase [Salsuginibacillus halophilus]
MVSTAYDPASGKKIGTFEASNPSDVPDIYERSRFAQQYWSSLSIKKRISYIRLLRYTLAEVQEEAASIIAASTGKTKTDALTDEILASLDAMKQVEKDAPLVLAKDKRKTPLHLAGKSSYVDRKPRGSVLIISPWNFPFQLGIIPVVEALAMGNSVVLKPSEFTPMVGELLKRFAAIFPEDVFQVVIGDGEFGEALTTHQPDFIHFTGSVAVGKSVQKAAAEQLTPTVLELGGKDPLIVCEDANVTRAAKGAVWGAFHHSGQICLSVERVYVHEAVYAGFLSEVKRETARLRQGRDEDADVGSMTTKKQLEIVKEHVQDALNKGAVLESGLEPKYWNDEDMFLQPMILTDVTHDMKIMQEETFGPIMPVMKVHSETDALELANTTSYGLGGSIFTKDLTKGEAMAHQLRTGNVNINDVMKSIVNPYLPYGGVGDSGIGKSRGRAGMQSFCIETSVLVDKGQQDEEFNWFPNAGKYEHFKVLIDNYWGEGTHVPSLLKAVKTLNNMSQS